MKVIGIACVILAAILGCAREPEMFVPIEVTGDMETEKLHRDVTDINISNPHVKIVEEKLNEEMNSILDEFVGKVSNKEQEVLKDKINNSLAKSKYIVPGIDKVIFDIVKLNVVSNDMSDILVFTNNMKSGYFVLLTKKLNKWKTLRFILLDPEKYNPDEAYISHYQIINGKNIKMDGVILKVDTKSGNMWRYEYEIGIICKDGVFLEYYCNSKKKFKETIEMLKESGAPGFK